MYSDDLSIYAAVNNYEDCLKLQYDLNELCKWAERRCLNKNYDKCKVIHFGHVNKAFNYKLNDVLINPQIMKKYWVLLGLLTLTLVLRNIYMLVLKKVMAFLI